MKWMMGLLRALGWIVHRFPNLGHKFLTPNLTLLASCLAFILSLCLLHLRYQEIDIPQRYVPTEPFGTLES